MLKIDKKFPSNQTSPIYKTYPKIKTSTGKTKVHINEGKVKTLILITIYDKKRTNTENFESQLSVISIHFKHRRKKTFVIN